MKWLKSLIKRFSKTSNKDKLIQYYHIIDFTDYEPLISLFKDIEEYNNYLNVLINSNYSIDKKLFISNNSFKNIPLVLWVNKGYEFIDNNSLRNNLLEFINLGYELLEYQKLSTLHYPVRDNVKNILIFLERKMREKKEKDRNLTGNNKYSSW